MKKICVYGLQFAVVTDSKYPWPQVPNTTRRLKGEHSAVRRLAMIMMMSKQQWIDS